MYTYFNLKNISLREWSVIYKFCIKKANLFRSGALENFEVFFKELKNSTPNVVKYFEYISTIKLSCGDFYNDSIKKDKSKKIFNYMIEKCGFFDLVIADIKEFQYIKELFKDVNGVKIMPGNPLEIEIKPSDPKYLCIAGYLSDACKSKIKCMDIFGEIQCVNSSQWQLNLTETKYNLII